MFLGADDLADLYEGAGDEVLLAGETAPRFGLFAEAGQPLFDGEVIGSAPSLRYPLAVWPVLSRGQQLTVAGRTWRVSVAPSRLGDGSDAIVMLEQVRGA